MAQILRTLFPHLNIDKLSRLLQALPYISMVGESNRPLAHRPGLL